MGIFTVNNMITAVKLNGLTESFLPPMILNMTITASIMILFVLLARLALKKAPKVFSYALWAVVLFRLLCPVSVTTDFSLLGLLDTPVVENTQHTTAMEYIPYDVVHTPDLEVHLPVPPVINEAVNNALPQEHAALGADPLEGDFAIGSMIWLLGIAGMAIYSAVSYFLLRRKLVGAVLLKDNIYLADGIGSPFVMGLIRPKIYLPSSLSEQEQSYIILHEQHHIRRGDHLVKALAFIALCIHWFNPLVWVAFILSSKDMEMSCDEAVVKKLGEGIRADYSASLLSLATGRRIIAGTPLAFGEGDTKSRIKNMLSWKKPKVWLIMAAAAVVIVIAVVCGTNASTKSTVKTEQTENGVEVMLTLKAPIRSYAIYEEIYQGGRLISGKPVALNGYADDDWDDMPYKHTFKLGVRPELLAGGGFSGELTSWHEENGAAAERKTTLPKDAYTGMGHIVGTGNVEGTLSKENHSIDAGDDVILLSVVLSTAPDGEICVYRNGWSLAKGNDTVVQYRLMTSTETVEAFEDMPLDLAQTLYDLRVETLNDPDDMGAQTALRILLDTMGASEFGDYELQCYDMSSKKQISTLKLAGEFWPGGSGQRPPYEKTGLCIWYSDILGEKEESAFAEANKGVVELLLALVPDLDEVMIGYPIEGGSAGYIGASDKDASYVKDRLGYKDLEELGQSAAGIRTLMQFFDWPAASLGTSEALGSYGTAIDVSYYLELAAGEAFQDMSLEKRVSLLVEYEDLLDDYTLIARETEDGKTAYIVGQYNGNPTESPLYGMYGVEVSSADGEDLIQFLYREEESETVNAVLEANKTEFPPSAGYSLEQSSIIWREDSGLVLILPRGNDLSLNVAWNRYLYTPNGREYIADAVSRGIDVCGRTETFLYFYLISERFGEIAERIALTEAEAQAILAEERVKITDGFGFSASLHIDGQTTYYNEREGIPQTVLDLAIEKCDYRFGDPSYITDTIREARLDCDWLDTPLYANEADLPRLREILKNAEHGYVGACGYGAKLTLTFTGGEKLTVFKGTDDCDTIVFGSYGGYFIGDEENREFWEMFGLDPNTKERIETAEPSEEELFFLRTGIQEAEAQEFYAEFITLIESDNREAVLDKILYPVSVTVDGGMSIANNAAELLPYYDDIFTDGLLKSIQAGQLGDSQADLFTNDGLIGAANGAIWFAGTQGVMTIQNPEGRSVRPVISGITAEGEAAITTVQLSTAEHAAAVDTIFANLRTDWWKGSQARDCAYESAAFECLHREANGNIVSLYGYGGYFRWDRNNTCIEYWYAPTIVTLDTDTQQVLDLWWPGDGAAHESSILDKFPEEIASAVAEPNSDRSTTVRNSLMEASKESMVSASQQSESGQTRRFGVQDLRVEITNVLSTHKTCMLAEGVELHEYVVVFCTPESKITVLDAGMSDPTYTEDGKPHPQWGLYYTDEAERTRITDETATISVTSDLEGIYNLEASLFVIQLNLVD